MNREKIPIDDFHFDVISLRSPRGRMRLSAGIRSNNKKPAD
jgi:hypothetical protein